MHCSGKPAVTRPVAACCCWCSWGWGCKAWWKCKGCWLCWWTSRPLTEEAEPVLTRPAAGIVAGAACMGPPAIAVAVTCSLKSVMLRSAELVESAEYWIADVGPACLSSVMKTDFWNTGVPPGRPASLLAMAREGEAAKSAIAVEGAVDTVDVEGTMGLRENAANCGAETTLRMVPIVAGMGAPPAALPSNKRRGCTAWPKLVCEATRRVIANPIGAAEAAAALLPVTP
mmetsp:Transcript_19498/g.48770  ORF Transcript_19498/g.48770 Transcript_19498/m.48770 type:complete len:229 (-) Transcript_19498:857-1543(-)